MAKRRHTHALCIAVPLVWGSLRLAPTRTTTKKEVLHSLAPALTLTLSLTHSHLANKLLRTTSTPHGLINVARATYRRMVDYHKVT